MSRRKITIIAGVALLATAAAGAVAYGARDRDGGDDDMMGGRGPGWHHGRHGGGWGDGEGRGHRSGGGWRERFGMGRGMTKEAFDTRTRERFARLDKNSDGVIDRAEIEAMQADRMQRRGHRLERRQERMLRRMGADASGKVTRDAFLDRIRKGFAQLDLDGDGRITDADLPPMMRGRGVLQGSDGAGARPMMGGGRGRGHGRPLMRMVREAAAKSGGTATLDGVLAVAETRFRWLDRNGDGVVDKADGEALVKEMATYRVDRFLHRFGARQSGQITREVFEKVAAERFAARDVDGDGVIGRGDRGGRGGWHGRGRGRDHGPRGEEGRGPGRGPDGSDEAPRDGAPRQN
ncbi:MAG: hypothetical protein R3D27_04820 [Hyphomicrobiaceae bacterium]